MLLELGPAHRLLQVLEAADEVERRRVEQRELLLHREREVGAVVEGVGDPDAERVAEGCQRARLA